MSGDAIGEVDLGYALQAFPRRHRVHFEHHEAAALLLDEVDSAIAGADRTRRGDGELGERPRAGRWLANAAAGDVGHPVGAVSDHRRHGLAADDEYAEVAPVALTADIALEIEHAAMRLGSDIGQGLVRRGAGEAAALGAEQG